MSPTKILSTLAALAFAGAVFAIPAPGQTAGGAAPTFSDPTTIDNPYLPLSKYSRCSLRGHEDDQRLQIKRKVLDRTRTFVVDGVPVETMIVKDRVRGDGKTIERTLDFFAQDDAGAVHYFGERVDNVRDGQVVNHHGGWMYGKDTDKIGVLMAADPHIGSHWLSEDAPPITVEHDRVVDRIARITVRGRTYDHVIKVREFALPDREVEYKLYAKGVGVIDELPPKGDVGLAGCARA